MIDLPAPIPLQLWVYRARTVRVIDGDTIDVLVDHGFHALAVERFRLLGVDTPEVRGETREAGEAARGYTISWLGVAAHEMPTELRSTLTGDWPLVIETSKSDSFGRWLAMVWRASDGACLNDDLLAAGMAVPYP